MKKKISLYNFTTEDELKKTLQIIISLIGILFIHCETGFAMSKKWEEFHSKTSVKMFFEPKTVRGKSIKKVVVMLNFEKSQIASDGKKIKSIRMIQDYDCTTSRFRLRSAINYSDKFLKGAEVSRGNKVTSWVPVPKGAPYSKLMNKICN